VHIRALLEVWRSRGEQSMRVRSGNYIRAFTLAELLVVIGIIALLISILLPVLSGAREGANRVKCMSNLRQLAAAFVAYANNNRGSFPGAADGVAGLTRPPRDTDWVYWQRGRDLDQSVIAPYLARGGTLKYVLRCPSDTPPPRLAPWPNTVWLDSYDYSYQMNFLLDGNPFEGPMSFYVPPRLQQVRRASDKILLGEPDGRLLSTASWYIGAGSGVDLNTWRPAIPLSIRHDQPSGLVDPLPVVGPPVNPDRRGNVAFCDGHVEFVPRSFVALREHADPRY
jgi:prepilin-type processing-associated H-X9-DG protein